MKTHCWTELYLVNVVITSGKNKVIEAWSATLVDENELSL
jgi:hypothetical protein